MSHSLVAPTGRRAAVAACALLSALAVVSFLFVFGPPRARAEPIVAEPIAPVAREAVSAADSAPSSLPLPPIPSHRITLTDSHQRAIEVYPPVTAMERAPMTVLLHATCMQPGPVCDRFGRAGRDGSFLVCPSGNESCYGEPDWHGSPEAKASFLQDDLDKVEALYGARIDRESGDVLVGWSRGAFAARDILYARAAAKAAPRFRGVVLIAAAVSPDPALFRAAGIRRAVFSAGDQDGARPTMQRAAALLSRAGIEAHYVTFGPIGHWLPEDAEARLRTEIAWAHGEEPAR